MALVSAARFVNVWVRTSRSRHLILPRGRPSRSSNNTVVSPENPSRRPKRSITGAAPSFSYASGFVSRLRSSPDENQRAPSRSNCIIVHEATEIGRLFPIGRGPRPLSETHHTPSGLSAVICFRVQTFIRDRLASPTNRRVPGRKTYIPSLVPYTRQRRNDRQKRSN